MNTASPAMYYVHVDHLNRPVRMTNSARATVWDAVWLPWGGVHTLTGGSTLNARLPGQWFQTESGLHYNWHRHYDPTSGRYTQPDPLGFVDGPSVYGYARGNPQRFVDLDGRFLPPSAPSMARTPRSPFPMRMPEPKIYVPPPRPERRPGPGTDRRHYHQVCDQPTPPELNDPERKCEKARWELDRDRLCLKLRVQWKIDYGPSEHDNQIPQRQKAVENAEGEVNAHCTGEQANLCPK